MVDIILLCPSLRTRSQEFSVINPSVLLKDIHHTSDRRLCVQCFMSSPLHHLSHRRLSVLICLQAPLSFFSCFGTLFSAAPFSYCIPHDIIKCRSWQVILPASQDGGFYVKSPMAPLMVYLRIWNSLIRQNVGALIRWFSSMRLHLDPETCCSRRAAAILFRRISESMAAAKISTSSAPTNVAFPPSSIHLLNALNDYWLSHKYSNGSSIIVSQSAIKNAAVSGWFGLESSSSCPILHCCSFFFLLQSLYPTPILPFLTEPSPGSDVTWPRNP